MQLELDLDAALEEVRLAGADAVGAAAGRIPQVTVRAAAPACKPPCNMELTAEVEE